MTDITPLVPEGRQLIQSYGQGRFRIAGAVYDGSVLVLPERTLPLAADEMAALSLDMLAPLWAAGVAVDVLLMGTGLTAAWPAADLRAGLRDKGIVAEPMSTAAACRTYNVLLAEDRRVAAALFAVP
ncbi:MAG: Mth938-like domain-containing protein [Rhodospirillales bacterium]